MPDNPFFYVQFQTAFFIRFVLFSLSLSLHFYLHSPNVCVVQNLFIVRIFGFYLIPFSKR